MKSDTPRTDALLHPGLDLADAHDIVDLCRQLERELTDAKSQRGTLAYSSHEGGWTALGQIIISLEAEISRLKTLT